MYIAYIFNKMLIGGSKIVLGLVLFTNLIAYII